MTDDPSNEDPSKNDEARGQAPQIKVKLPEKLAGGVYANNMLVSHTREEFLLDFMTAFSPRAGIVTARVVVSPGHLKRIVRALSENLGRYEAQFGPLAEAAPPDDDKVH